MLGMTQAVLNTSSGMGFPLTPLSAHVDWVLAEWTSADYWIEDEIRLNHILPRYQAPVISTYDCYKLGTGVAMDVLRTHPVAVIGGVLQENPFYQPPDELLRELSERRNRKASRSADSNGYSE